jgi:UDP-N-acetylmuramate dehydrogenase
MAQPSEKHKDLPPVRGTLTRDAPIGRDSWFGCGGAADLLFEPADFNDLADFLKNYPEDAPLLVMGGMANTIVRDGGVRGCVVRLGKNFAAVHVDGTRIETGAGALNGTVAQAAAKNGLGGLEFLSGVPGSIGGAIRMNAGAYGSEVKDVLHEATVVDRTGCVRRLSPADMAMGYRSTNLPDTCIVTHAVFTATQESTEKVRARLKLIKSQRQETQPIMEKTGGSTFANPSAEDLKKAGLPPGMKAWELIDQVGGRGHKIGGAQMSEKHCNFMINAGGASAADLEALGEEIRARVREKFGFDLCWEIKRIGEK